MKKATIRPTAIPQSSFRLSRPDRAIVENRFTLPVSRPIILVKSESDLSLVTLEAKLSAIRLFSRSRISSTAPGL